MVNGTLIHICFGGGKCVKLHDRHRNLILLMASIKYNHWPSALTITTKYHLIGRFVADTKMANQNRKHEHWTLHYDI